MKTVHFLILLLSLISVNIFTKNEPVNRSVKDTIIVGYNMNPPFIFKENNNLKGISYLPWKE